MDIKEMLGQRGFCLVGGREGRARVGVLSVVSQNSEKQACLTVLWL